MVLVSNFRHNQKFMDHPQKEGFPSAGYPQLRSAEPVRSTEEIRQGHKKGPRFSSPTTQETSLDKTLVELQILLRLLQIQSSEFPQMEKLGITCLVWKLLANNLVCCGLYFFTIVQFALAVLEMAQVSSWKLKYLSRAIHRNLLWIELVLPQNIT